MDRDLKSCQLIASDKSNLLRKVHFLLNTGFQVIVFFILLEVGHLATIVVKMSTTIIFGTLQNKAGNTSDDKKRRQSRLMLK